MVRAGPIRCVTCNAPSTYRHCSDACFKAWSKTRVGVDCSICRYDPTTGRSGSLKTSRICGDCSDDPANGEWKDTSRRERKGFEMDEYEAGAHCLEIERTEKFRTPVAIKAVQQVAAGASHQEAADTAECSVDYVKQISAHWNRNTAKLLKALNKENRKKG